MALLTLGLLIGNRKSVFYTADLITEGQLSANKAIGNNIKNIIDEAIKSRGNGERGMLSTIEVLFEKFTYQGVVFSTDLLMYEKALITLKGVLAAGIGVWLVSYPIGFWCALAAVVGHVFPIWHRLRGGRGVATAIGAVLFLEPLFGLILAINLVRVGMARLAQLHWPACPVVIKPLDFDFEAVLDSLFLLVLIFHLDF